ncbi:MAG TPA: polysaccharide deacetylase family protein [Elusimicrobiota bacterium]|nr:polysaccharide deacetylase family protein [Elusimicrobiota bacterium]
MTQDIAACSEKGQPEGSAWVLRRYHAVSLILCGVMLGSVALFSRDSEFFPTQPRYPYRIALTFDDGPHPAFTDRLLRVLSENKAVATFFVVGTQAEKYPVLLRTLARQGHELANHTFHHRNLTTISEETLLQELGDTARLIEETTGKRCRYFRPPGGRYNQGTLDLASHNGYRMILWTVFPRDHSAVSAQEVYDRVMASASDGGVVLLHSGMEGTLRILPKIIQDLRARGFEFLTISEMLHERISPRVLSSWYLPKTPPPALEDDTYAVAGTDLSVDL